MQLDDYKLFSKKIHEIHGQHGCYSRKIEVTFNHWTDNKIHFQLKPDGQERIITFDRFSKGVWNYLKDKKIHESVNEPKSIHEYVKGGCELITWTIYEVMTASEAEKVWSTGKGTVRKYISLKMFEDHEHRKSGSTWLVTREGMTRVFGDKKKKSH